MRTRIITAIVMVALMIPFFVFSDTVAFPVLIAFLSAVGAYEMVRCAGLNKNGFITALLVLLAGIPFIFRYTAKKIEYAFVIYFAYFVIISIIALFSDGIVTVTDSALSTGYVIYISFGLSSLILLRDMKNGICMVFLPFVVSWITDTFAYFCGMAFGKHKLIPSVSPKKTVEGSIGGTVCAVVLTVLYCFIAGKSTGSNVSYVAVAVIALVCSLLSQCGDLIMSLVKRHYGIKDYGKLFPGHGGVLDRFDSIIITSPFIYLLSAYIPFCEVFK